jgi:hypothetical protein
VHPGCRRRAGSQGGGWSEAARAAAPAQPVADASTGIVVEPGEETHELVGDRMRTVSKTVIGAALPRRNWRSVRDDMVRLRRRGGATLTAWLPTTGRADA